MTNFPPVFHEKHYRNIIGAGNIPVVSLVPKWSWERRPYDPTVTMPLERRSVSETCVNMRTGFCSFVSMSFMPE